LPGSTLSHSTDGVVLTVPVLQAEPHPGRPSQNPCHSASLFNSAPSDSLLESVFKVHEKFHTSSTINTTLAGHRRGRYPAVLSRESHSHNPWLWQSWVAALPAELPLGLGYRRLSKSRAAVHDGRTQALRLGYFFPTPPAKTFQGEKTGDVADKFPTTSTKRTCNCSETWAATGLPLFHFVVPFFPEENGQPTTKGIAYYSASSMNC